MKPLDTILIEYFGAPNNVDTSRDTEYYEKLLRLLTDLEALGLSINAPQVQNELDEIVSESSEPQSKYYVGETVAIKGGRGITTIGGWEIIDGEYYYSTDISPVPIHEKLLEPFTKKVIV